MKDIDFLTSKLRQAQSLLLHANNELARKQQVIEAQEEELQSYEDMQKTHMQEMDGMKSELASSRKECEDKGRRIAELEELVKVLTRKAEESTDMKKLIADCKNANVDFEAIIKTMQRQMWGQHTDQSKYLDGDFGIDEQRLEELGFENVVSEMSKKLEALDPDKAKAELQDTETPELPPHKEKKKVSEITIHRRNKFSIRILERLGIDTSNLPDGAVLIHRRDKATGDDVWYVRRIQHTPGTTGCIEYEIGRFNIKNGDPMCSKHPESIIPGNPLLPSFARFYLEYKIRYNVSESNILDMLHDMEAFIPQSSLNKWMHQIMSCLREHLQMLMIEVIKQSTYTNNDETRILVRNLLEDGSSKYKVEYIHSALSLEKKLVVMLYGEGSRSHEIQEEQIFKDSGIRIFTADRAALYETIVKDLEEKYGIKITRTACWLHFRHYLVDAYVSDKRVQPLIELINYLFYIERESNNREYTPEQRQVFRLRYSRKVVTTIFKILKRMKAEAGEYGAMVMRAINYALDDEDAFKQFLQNGLVEMQNISIERCFRHIAMGRRNWMHTGSHDAAQNLAFMYSLFESCKMNKINFGTYIEDILTRIMKGDKDYLAMLPCYYAPRETEQKDAA